MTMTVRNVRVLPSDHLGAASASDPDDVVLDDVIVSIDPPSGAPSSGDLDGTGRFLVPGLIDTHAHLGSRDALTNAVHAGVTTLVDLGTYPDARIAEQRAWSEAPTIISAGSAASAPGSTQIARMGFPAESGVVTPADAERYLDWRVRNGSDLIKIIIEDPAVTDVPALTVETIAALVDGAHERGLLTVAHVTTAAAFVRGLDAGVDVLTHAPLDRVLPDTTIARMLDQGTIAAPTLVMMRTMARARLGDRADAAFRNALDSVRAMHAAGVPVVVGTDANESPMAPVRHGIAVHDEIDLLLQAGMTPAEAFAAATSAAADAVRLTDRGRVRVGARADHLLVDADPTTQPQVLRRPAAIWVGGAAVATDGQTGVSLA